MSSGGGSRSGSSDRPVRWPLVKPPMQPRSASPGCSSSFSWPDLVGHNLLVGHLGVMQHIARDSLPPTPRSPSPTCSPPLSPKRHRSHPESLSESSAALDSAAEDEIELRAAALGLNETTQRVWRETALPPTPSSPSPTYAAPRLRVPNTDWSAFAAPRAGCGLPCLFV